MAFIRNITEYQPQSNSVTSLRGVVDKDCTYEILDDSILILRTDHDIIHIMPDEAEILIELLKHIIN